MMDDVKKMPIGMKAGIVDQSGHDLVDLKRNESFDVSDNSRPSAERAEPDAKTMAGQAVYDRRTLAIYDWWVHGVSNRWIWRCPTERLHRLYRERISANHLDVGVGSGLFLDRALPAVPSPRVVLMDLNKDSLAFAAERIERYAPQTLQANVLEPIAWTALPFDSVGINYLLHCLPGTLPEKSAALDHLLPLLRADGTLFGSTILHTGVPRNWSARHLMRIYNRRQIFSNSDDSLQGLTEILQARLDDVVIEVAGCVALFTGKKPAKSRPAGA
jgi:SAM-dependent methyltransferase